MLFGAYLSGKFPNCFGMNLFVFLKLEEMNSVYSGRKWIMSIQGRNEQCLFWEEMNSVYSGKKWIMSIQGRNE